MIRIMHLGTHAAAVLPFVNFVGTPEGMDRAMNHDRRFPVARDSQRVIQESGIGFIETKVVNDEIVSVRKLVVFEQVQVEAHIEGDICQLADVGRQMRRELLIIVITTAGEK